MCCVIFPKQFKTRLEIEAFDFRKESIHGLAFSQYIEDETLTPDHRKNAGDAAKYFLKRIPKLIPSDVLTNPAHLLFFMRQDYIEQQEFQIETVARLAAIEERLANK